MSGKATSCLSFLLLVSSIPALAQDRIKIHYKGEVTRYIWIMGKDESEARFVPSLAPAFIDVDTNKGDDGLPLGLSYTGNGSKHLWLPQDFFKSHGRVLLKDRLCSDFLFRFYSPPSKEQLENPNNCTRLDGSDKSKHYDGFSIINLIGDMADDIESEQCVRMKTAMEEADKTGEIPSGMVYWTQTDEICAKLEGPANSKRKLLGYSYFKVPRDWPFTRIEGLERATSMKWSVNSWDPTYEPGMVLHNGTQEFNLLSRQGFAGFLCYLKEGKGCGSSGASNGVGAHAAAVHELAGETADALLR